jgi:hypothetical protein
VISFVVRDIEEVVRGLQGRSVVFEPLAAGTFAGQEGVDRGVIMDRGPARSAFLKDSEGNVLALNEFL